ncbi:MAG: YigZ family protein [Chloroflexi bacterium]|nr:YigZ family protein [Chloroflexota bacterium]
MTQETPYPHRYLIPDDEASAEISVRNSVFIGTVCPAPTIEAAHNAVAQVRQRYPDANHNAWAFVISGGPSAVIGSSDDGEPGGTAGRPMLAVLEGHGLLQAVAIGTRYFGGTKLGTGGLVRAYSDCVRAALKGLPLAEMVFHHRASITVDYGLYGTLKYALPKQGVVLDDEIFGESVSLSLLIPPSELQAVGILLSNMTSGQIQIERSLDGGHYVKSTL